LRFKIGFNCALLRQRTVPTLCTLHECVSKVQITNARTRHVYCVNKPGSTSPTSESSDKHPVPVPACQAILLMLE